VHDKVEARVPKVSAGAGSIDGSTGDRFGAMCNTSITKSQSISVSFDHLPSRYTVSHFPGHFCAFYITGPGSRFVKTDWRNPLKL
jgi:hypothetical protein